MSENMSVGYGMDACVASRLLPSPDRGSTNCVPVHRWDLVVGLGFGVLAAFTIWVKARAGLSDILHHAVGEMARRVRGGALAPSTSDTSAAWEPAGAPNRPPAARGRRVPPPFGRGDRRTVLCRRTNHGFMAEGEEEDRAIFSDLLNTQYRVQPAQVAQAFSSGAQANRRRFSPLPSNATIASAASPLPMTWATVPSPQCA